MTTQVSPIFNSYILSVNNHDSTAFGTFFDNNAIVHDACREFHGLAAIKAWSDCEIFGAHVTLEVIDIAERDGEVIIKTKVDGTFDRIGLPDPVIINHYITIEGDKIARLICRLAS